MFVFHIVLHIVLFIIFTNVFIVNARNITKSYEINITSLDNASQETFLQALSSTSYLLDDSTEELLQHPILQQYTIDQLSQTYSIVNNLNTFLSKVTTGRCLIVLNNFKGVDLPPFSSTPILQRRFSLALLSHLQEDFFSFEFTDIVWAPPGTRNFTKGFFELPTEGQKTFIATHPCPVSRIITPIILGEFFLNTCYCVGIDLNAFVHASKLWQCQIQVDLFIPNYLLEVAKFTQIFRDKELPLNYFAPSTVPQLNILIHSELNLNEIGAMYKWTNRDDASVASDNSYYTAVTDILVSASTICYNKPFGFVCNIDKSILSNHAQTVTMH